MDALARNDADRRKNDIEKMITREPDESKRANLVALNAINNSVITNTELAHALCERMEKQEEALATHVRKGDRLFYFGKGVWFILSAVLVLAQAVTLGGLIHLNNSLELLHAVDISTATEIAAMKGEIQGMRGIKGDTGETGPRGAKGAGFWGDHK